MVVLVVEDLGVVAFLLIESSKRREGHTASFLIDEQDRKNNDLIDMPAFSVLRQP